MTDPSRESYGALGFTRKLSGILSAKALVGGIRALRDGHHQSGIQGDAMQLGGAVVIGPGPALYFYYRSNLASDHPPVEKIVEASTSMNVLVQG